mmetsp:Transcript_272/g.326  ORF Transcript_272/g.326 Transcript_272/m.326 type:complete len:177 (+) Transcript_272:113-643(+)
MKVVFMEIIMVFRDINGSNDDIDDRFQQSITWEKINNAGIAQLTKHPRCLHYLWNEYECGIGVNKAAKNFTPSERGKVKHRYCLRKIFWDAVSEMVTKRGWSSSQAIETIKEVYKDNSSISKILLAMRIDRNSIAGFPKILRGNPPLLLAQNCNLPTTQYSTSAKEKKNQTANILF